MLAPALLERLRPLGYTGGVTILRDRLRRLRPHGHREAFLTLDFPPGEAMQVDWADYEAAINAVEASVDLDAVLAAAREAPALAYEEIPSPTIATRVRVAVARDEAFWFYDEASLEALRDRVRWGESPNSPCLWVSNSSCPALNSKEVP